MTHPLTKIRAIIDSPPFTITKQPNPYETPYIPSSQLQISSFDDSSGLPYVLKNIPDVVMPIADSLKPQDLANLAEVSKACYLATKVWDMWENQLQKLLPAVTKSPKFDAEDQFKIIYKRINDWPKALRYAFDCNNKLLGRLGEPNGLIGLIGRAWRDSQVAGSNLAMAREEEVQWMASLNTCHQIPTSEEEFELLFNQRLKEVTVRHEQITKLQTKHTNSLRIYNRLNSLKTVLVGAVYDGPINIQARILEILESQSPRTEAVAEFNCQPNFDKAIQQAFNKQVSNKKDQQGQQLNYLLILILFTNLSLMFASLYDKDSTQ